MNRFPWPLAGLILFGFSGAAQAEAPGDMLVRYAAEAKKAEPAFEGFSADRGRQFYLREHPTEKGQTACSTCHTPDARRSGLTRTNKVIEPLAPSANSERFTDGANVEKWFRRNCGDVLGRSCTAREKGDVMTYLLTLQ